MDFPSIGGISFVHLGETAPVGSLTEVVTRKNTNGLAVQVFATGGEEELITAVRDIKIPGDAADLETFIKTVIALQGTIVTLVTNSQITRPNMTVLHVRMLQQQLGGADNPVKVPLNVGGINGTLATHLISFEFTLIDGSVTP